MASRKQPICFKDFNEALAENPETYGHIDVLCGGWPCQDNSIAGKRKGHAGEKSGLFSEFCRVLRLFKPTWFLGENVPGFLSVNEGKDFCQVIAELQEIGYGLSWRILDSQYFGVAQRRRRLFFVGRFGNFCPPEILFEQEGGYGNYKKVKKVGSVGLCISTREGEHRDPTRESLVANTITQKETQQYSGTAKGRRNIVAHTIIGKDGRTNHPTNQNTIAFTIGTDLRGQPYKLHTETLVAKANPNGEGKIARFPRGLDSMRGVIIGNAVTVNVARWIGERIIKYEKSLTHPKESGNE